jgi:hypothetical protein
MTDSASAAGVLDYSPLCSVFDDPGREERAGWFRVNFNYFIDVAVVDYVVDAAHLIANEGVKLLGAVQVRSLHRTVASPRRAQRPPVSLYDISYASGAMEFRAQRATPPERVLAELQDPVLPASFERIHWSRSLREAQRELAALGRNSQ